MKGFTSFMVGIFTLLMCAAVALAAGQGGVQVVELKAAANRSITFRISAPQAKEVRVFVDTMAQTAALPLNRDENGVWSGTLGPFAPDIYVASCVIDGVVSGVGFVHVPGPTPEAWDPRQVPHGTIHQRW